jgi:hypothetical protein
MRSLHRNARLLYYSVPVNTEPILDDYGNDTLEVKTVFSKPVELSANVSANVGQDAVDVFGSVTGYNRTISYVGSECPLTEGTRVWFGVDVKKSHNYLVVKVADSKSGFLIALREVTERGENNTSETDEPEYQPGD